MKQRWLGVVVPLVVLVAMGLATRWWRPADSSPSTGPVVECADLARGCIAMLGANRVAVTASGQPDTLKPFHLTVAGTGMDALSVEFSMRGMDMGFNRYRMLRSPGGWEGNVILPVCSAGRRDWILALDDGKDRVRIGFSVRQPN